MRTILISGASIAGPTLAWWLNRNGFEPTLVERMPGAARGGHAIDVRGPALDVLEAMGLRDEVYHRRMQLKGVSVVDAAGMETWRSEEMTISGGKFDNEDIEILRDRLSNALTSSLPDQVETLYGDSIVDLVDDGQGVEVTFASGKRRRFDIVVGADGIGSKVRNLAFGGDAAYLHPFGIALAPFSAPNLLGIADWQISYREPDGNGYMVYTTPDNTQLRVCFRVPATLEDLPPDRASQMARIRQHCGRLGWETPRFLDAMETAPDFYLGLIAQVKMDHWAKGRVALVGDAAFCPSPYTGQGTSLAIVGAYVLAFELAASRDDPTEAFARYEKKMRPFVAANQAIADLTRDERFGNDPAYYHEVVEPAIDTAKSSIRLDW